jgi:hypothetical protein
MSQPSLTERPLFGGALSAPLRESYLDARHGLNVLYLGSLFHVSLFLTYCSTALQPDQTDPG